MPEEKQLSTKKPPVMFIPGSMLPSQLAYGPLLGILGDQIQPIVKELEVYTTPTPPTDYGLEMEVEGILKAADSAGVKRFHLVGYSAGGAFALAFTAKYPERLKSLALVESAWIGSLDSPEDVQDWESLERAMSLPPDDRMRAFIQWHMLPGIEPPKMAVPPGPPPAWMELRPAGIEAISRAYNAYSLDQDRFRRYEQPVYYALGGLSTRFFERTARILTGLFPHIQIEEYEGRSHLDPPHRAEPERFAQALRELWAHAGSDQ